MSDQELVVCGVLGTWPTKRRRPDFVNCVVRDPVSGQVILPPGLSDEDILSAAEWADMLKRGDATRLDETPVRAGQCAFIPEGDAPPEVVSYEECLTRLHRFCDERMESGLVCARKGYIDSALGFVADAIAVASRPADYKVQAELLRAKLAMLQGDLNLACARVERLQSVAVAAEDQCDYPPIARALAGLHSGDMGPNR